MPDLVAFLEQDLAKMRDNKSIIGKLAARLWPKILRKCLPGNFESWAMAMFFCCTEDPNPPQNISAYANEECLYQAAMNFWTSLKKNSAKLEQSPLWKEFCAADTPERKMETLSRFMDKGTEQWRNDCIDTWRRKPGTFAYTHRRLQKALREKLPESSWSLYDPKSRFYGPSDLLEPIERIDIKDGQFLKKISKPANAPASSKIYYAENAVSLAKWIYHALLDSALNKSRVLAIRNFARWLCFQYPELLTWEILPEDEKEEKSLKNTSPYLEEEIVETARKAASLLTPLQRRIIILRNGGSSLEEIMNDANLVNIATVSRELEKAIRIVHEITLESALIEGSEDSDSPYSISSQDAPKEIFMKNFISFCEKGAAYAT